MDIEENVVSIKCDLLSEDGNIQSLWLPLSSEQIIRFDDVQDIQIKEKLYFILKDGQWYVCAEDPIYFINPDGDSCSIVQLKNQDLIFVENLHQNYTLYITNIYKDKNIFHNYYFPSDKKIFVGNHSDNDIIFKNKCIARRHAAFYYKDDALYVADMGSYNGVRVNGRKCENESLKLGDNIYLFGLTIIVGLGFISINDEYPNVEIKADKLKRIDFRVKTGTNQNKTVVNERHELFNRLPRIKDELEIKTISLEAPPMSLNGNNIPIMLRMGGSMVMGGASALSGNYLMLLSSVLFPILNQRYSEEEKQKYEIRRTEKYILYLDEKNSEISDIKDYEEKFWKRKYPDLGNILQYPLQKTRLWERRRTDDDFLNIRIGSGSTPLSAQIEYPEQRFNLEEDPLEDEMYKVATAPIMLEDVPIMLDLVKNYICSILAENEQMYLLVRRMIAMISVLHSYDEVKIVILGERNDVDKLLEFVKYIPHVWNDQRNIRFIATNPGEAYKIGEVIQRETEADIGNPRELREIMKSHPYYVVFALSKQIFDSMEILKDVMQQEKNCGVSIITGYNDLPKECMAILDLTSVRKNSVIYLQESSKSTAFFIQDVLVEEDYTKSMKQLANISLKNIDQAYSLPKTVTFLELYKVGKVEQLNITQRWVENNPVKSLSVPIGIATDGSIFNLDLHQDYQGPHGLVAGTTGSGKSQFLLTYILSMAVNYHPDEVAFVLIDYKGGGLADAFDAPEKGIHLPHLVGTITNLDGASTQRSLISIQSELHRREKAFHDAKSLTDEGTMDIYTYQKLYRNKLVEKPMPHLFIISDEFAELKQQQPDFMEQLISAARIGRSLGIHLILATQKPAGVVNDQIRSNTKFRVCLKVQDKADSQDMLKRPEAAELRETGRFYLQVGYNEFFALGQSAYCGADYIPQEEVVIQKDNSVQIIDSIGHPLVEVQPITERGMVNGTQLGAIIKLLTDISIKNQISIRQLWRPLLKKQLDLLEINREQDIPKEVSYNLGMLDDPENQDQYLLNYDLERSRHLLIVGDALSGKTSLLQGMVYWLVRQYSPKQIQFYILDYSARTLSRFKKLPHVGAVLTEEDSERLDSFFAILCDIVNERKKLFSDLGVDNYLMAKEKAEIPLIIVMIDNLSGLSTTKKGEQHAYKLQQYLKDGYSYGIKYIVSVSHLNDISTRVRQEIGDRLCLHMRDRYEYGDALNSKVTYTPQEIPGRGMYVWENRPLEMQVAMYHAEVSEIERAEMLEKEVDAFQEKYRGFTPAKRLPVISEEAEYYEFAEQFSLGRIPLGYSKESGKSIALPFRQMDCLSIYIGNINGKVPILSNFLHAIDREHMSLWFVKKRKESHYEKCIANSTLSYSGNLEEIEAEESSLDILWHKLGEEIINRMSLQTQYCKEYSVSDEEKIEKSWKYMQKETEPLVLMFEDFGDFCKSMDLSGTEAQLEAGVPVTKIVFDKLFKKIKGLNIYVIALFTPEEDEFIQKDYLYSSFNQDENIILFGGSYEKQSLVKFPEDTGKKLPFNVGIMKYRNSFHIILMPCGKIETEMEEPDIQDIFM